MVQVEPRSSASPSQPTATSRQFVLEPDSIRPRGSEELMGPRCAHSPSWPCCLKRGNRIVTEGDVYDLQRAFIALS